MQGFLFTYGLIGMEPITLSDALEALNSARADLSALEALSTEHKATLEALADSKRDNGAMVLAIENLQNEKVALQAQIEAFKAMEADANAKAVEIVAAIGVEPVAIITEPVDPKQTLQERLNGISDSRERGRIRKAYTDSLNN